MNEIENNKDLIEKLKEIIKEGKIDTAVNIIARYLNKATEENYIDYLESVLEIVSATHGGKSVLRFLIENSIIDIPTLLKNLSKKDSVFRYSLLLFLKSVCEEECDLLLPYSDDLLNSEDPNVREAVLQMLLFMAGGEKKIEEESLIQTIALKLTDEKDFVVKKAIQALIAIGKRAPSVVTRILTNYIKKFPEVKQLKKNCDAILKSIVTIERIEEIVEVEESKSEMPVEELVEKEKELVNKEIELKEKEKKLEDKEVELEIKEILSELDFTKIEKEKQLKEKEIELQEKEVELKEKEINLVLENKIDKEEIPKELVEEHVEILDKELELKKKDLEIKKKKLEIEEKEKELEEIKIIEREKTLQKKKELLEKEQELAQVELELKEKSIKEKEQKILEEEIKRTEEKIKVIEQKEEKEDKENQL